MRGKFRNCVEFVEQRLRPSMRPAHYAREVAQGGALAVLLYLPSMRPAHYAREVADLF